MNKQFMEEKTHMANKWVKTYTTLIVIGKITEFLKVSYLLEWQVFNICILYIMYKWHAYIFA